MIYFQWYKFSELTIELLYSVLALRADVFISEQNRVCVDPDGKDINALHLIGVENGVLVAYLRLFPPTEIENYITFGRVITARFIRTKGYGKLLIQELLCYCNNNFPDVGIVCCAQHYLKNFYENFGFKSYGGIYEVDGIPHISMRKEPFGMPGSVDIFLETKRLVLRKPDAGDFEGLLALRGDPMVMRFIGYGEGQGRVQTPKEVRRFLEGVIQYHERHGHGFCPVFEKSTGDFVGQAGLFHVSFDELQSEMELAYRLHRKYWGRGYATELARALIQWGFSHLPHRRLVAVVHPDNTASRRVLEKAGMALTGHVRFGQQEMPCFEILRPADDGLNSFSTTRLWARRLQPDDLTLYWRLNSDPQVARTPGKRTWEQSRESFLWNVAHWEQNGFGIWMFFLPCSGEYVGRAGLRRIMVDGREEVELGYSLLPAFWGQGIATEMAAACREIACQRLGLDGIISMTTPDNFASIRVMEKLGLCHEKRVVHEGKECVVYRLKSRDCKGTQ